MQLTENELQLFNGSRGRRLALRAEADIYPDFSLKSANEAIFFGLNDDNGLTHTLHLQCMIDEVAVKAVQGLGESLVVRTKGSRDGEDFFWNQAIQRWQTRRNEILYTGFFHWPNR